MSKSRTQALSIPMDVKKAVALRDACDGWPCCVLCGTPAPSGNTTGFSNAHYISRAQGGLGVEENILTLCPRCHRGYDGDDKEHLKPVLRRYLRECYQNWDEENLVYKR